MCGVGEGEDRNRVWYLLHRSGTAAGRSSRGSTTARSQGVNVTQSPAAWPCCDASGTPGSLTRCSVPSSALSRLVLSLVLCSARPLPELSDGRMPLTLASRPRRHSALKAGPL